MQSAESLAVVNFRVSYSASWSFAHIQSFVHKFHLKYQHSASYIRGLIKSALLSTCTVDGVWYYSSFQISLHTIALAWWIIFYWSLKIISHLKIVIIWLWKSSFCNHLNHTLQYSISLHLYHHYTKDFRVDPFSINFLFRLINTLLLNS